MSILKIMGVRFSLLKKGVTNTRRRKDWTAIRVIYENLKMLTYKAVK